MCRGSAIQKTKSATTNRTLPCHILATASPSVASNVVNEQGKQRERCFQFARTLWSYLLTLDSTVVDEYVGLNLEDQDLFKRHRCEEYAAFDWTWLRAALSNICDFEDYLRTRTKSLCRQRSHDQRPPSQVDIDEYVRLRANGTTPWADNANRRGGPSVGRSIAATLRWWRSRAGLAIPVVSDPPCASSAQHAIQRPRRQAVPVSIAIMVHCERWCNSTMVAAAIFAGGCCFMGYGRIRFRHAQRAKHLGLWPLCMTSFVSRGKGKDDGGRRGYTLATPRTSITDEDWLAKYFDLMAWYSGKRGAPADFAIPGFCVNALESELSGSAMTYQQFRDTITVFLSQPPLNLQVDVAAQLSGHSWRRFLLTVATPLQLDEPSENALGNWAGCRKNPKTHMPTRYSGSRELIQLGAKTEVALAAQWAYQQAGKGNEATRNLTWASFHLILARDGRPNFYHKTLAQLASQQNPTGETTCLDILTWRSCKLLIQMLRLPMRAQKSRKRKQVSRLHLPQ